MASRDDEVRRLIVEQAAEWHVAQSEGTLDPYQAQEFMHWLRASPRHVAEYLSIAAIDEELRAVVGTDRVAIAELLKEPGAEIRQLPLNAASQPIAMSSAPYGSARAFRLRRWLAAIAVLIVMVGLTVAGRQLIEAPSFAETVATQRGQTLSLRLPDGTTLKLDAESKVKVQFGRWHRRATLVRGQAYFNVRHDYGRPFSVAVGPILIRDIGTVFNVGRQATHDTITVARGQVSVWSLDNPTPALSGLLQQVRTRWHPHQVQIADLGPRQQLQVSNSGRVLSLTTVNLWEALAWTEGRITFESTPIARVADEFNRHNTIQIEVADQSIGAMKISGTFEASDVQAFVAFLRTLPGVAVVANGRYVQVRVAPHVHRR